MTSPNGGPRDLGPLRDGGLLVTENGARRRYARLPGIRPELSEPVRAHDRVCYTVSVGGVRVFDVEVDPDTGEVFVRNRREAVIPLKVSLAVPSHIYDVYVLLYSSYPTLLTMAYVA